MHDNLKSGHGVSFVHMVSFALFFFPFQYRVALLVIDLRLIQTLILRAQR